MSRRSSNHQRRTTLAHNPHQSTTVAVPSNGYHIQPHQSSRQYRNGSVKPISAADVGYSDATSDPYYDYYRQNEFHQVGHKDGRNTDVTFSDDSGSIRLPYLEFDEESVRAGQRYSRTSMSERSYERSRQSDQRRAYANHESQWDRLYHEIQTPCENIQITDNNVPTRMPASRQSDRPQSSMSSAITTATVYGCGGKCQTFENVCYFFLQLIFTMGILVGVSLCIAGLVLRKSAARNLQVLIYIGVLLALVCSLLLGIQCSARSAARNRKKAIQLAKRAPIPMETLNLRANPLQHQQMINAIRESQRRQLPHVHNLPPTTRPLPPRPYNRVDTIEYTGPVIEEQQGIPWWRRKDLNIR